MSDPTIHTAVSAAHLVHAVVPAGTAEPVLSLDRARGRVDTLITLTDAVRGRLPLLPVPPRQETLPELVQVARRRLREDRARVTAEELGARRLVLDRVIEGLTP